MPKLREWLRSRKPDLLIEPFVDGGIVSLTAVFENLVAGALMVELDEEVAAVWQTIVDGDGEWLAKRILAFDMSRDAAIEVISQKRRSSKERAFQTIIKTEPFTGAFLQQDQDL